MALHEIQQQVDDLVRDDSGQIGADARDRAIAQAVSRLSGELPRTVTVDITGASGQKIATPADWVDGVSRIDSIEYPLGDVPPTLIEATRFMLLTEVDGSETIGLVDELPEDSTIRVRFTCPHEVDGQTDTVPDAHRWGVVCLAASILAGQLASWFANSTNSTIQADAVEHRSKSELWASRERQYERQAYAAWGLPLPTSDAAIAQGAPAGVVKSFEPRRGNRYLRWW